MKESRRPRVVVADDEYVITRCLAFMLKKEGFDCRTASDGVAAIEAVRELPPEVLVLDLDMPRRDGFEVCRDVRADPRLAAVRVIVLTAQGQPMWRDWQSRIPADAFLLKPFDPRSLLDRIRALAAASLAASEAFAAEDAEELAAADEAERLAGAERD